MEHSKLPNIAEVMNIQIIAQHMLNIPVYQRPYSWMPEHGFQMLSDIMEDFLPTLMNTTKNNLMNAGISLNASYGKSTMGTLVAYETPLEGGGRRMDIVDGQQRITTLTLLAVCLRNIFQADRSDQRLQPLYQEIERFLGTWS